MEENQKNSMRMENLETSIMHLQKDFESLNEVVLETARRIERLTKAFQRLTDRLQSSSGDHSERQAEDEIPPHY